MAGGGFTDRVCRVLNGVTKVARVGVSTPDALRKTATFTLERFFGERYAITSLGPGSNLTGKNASKNVDQTVLFETYEIYATIQRREGLCE